MSSALTRALRVLADCLGSSTSGRGAAAAVKAVPPSFSAQTHRNSRGLRVSRAAAAVLEPLEERMLMSTTYYVSNAGNDSNKGTISSPWKTPAKVSSTHLNPGDQVLFDGGETFSGGMNLYNDGGSASDPVVIGSYGTGRATINSGSANGAWSLNSTGMTFENLIFVGKGGSTGSQDGIRLENYTSNTVRSGFVVNNCDISGYAQGGVVFGYDSSSEGLNDISITNNTIHNTIMVGIESFGIVTQGSISSEHNTNVYIANNLVHDVQGDGVSFSTGSGIELQGLNGATVERNSSYNNGIHGTGVVGIWCYSSNAVTFQYNQSYNNTTRDGNDGDGFDFDADTSNSIMQYNFAANNEGGGLQLNEWWNDNDETGDIVRYNISQNNGRKNNYAGIDVWGKVENAQIYNNTVYITPAISGTTQALRISNNTITSLKPSNITIVGNIFVSSGGADLVNGYSAAITGSSGIHFAGNVYYAIGAFNLVYDGVTYHTLAAWEAATGQEMLSGKAVGLSTNPLLKSVGTAVPPATAASLSSITAYDPVAGSPVLTSSFTETATKALDVLSVSKDFAGSAVPAAVIAGAIETTTSGSSSSSTTTTTSGSTSGSTTGSSTATGTTTTGSNTSTGTTTSALSLTGVTIGTATGSSSSGSGTSYTVTGGGSDIWGTSDDLRYDYTSLTGNGQIIAEISSQQEPSDFAKSGVMIRSGTAANAAEVSMLIEPDKKTEFQTRSTVGGSTTTSEVDNVTYNWVKLVRSGNTFTGYVSTNGTSWTLMGTSTVTMSSQVAIGLAVTSHDSSGTNKATFTNVSETSSTTTTGTTTGTTSNGSTGTTTTGSNSSSGSTASPALSLAGATIGTASGTSSSGSGTSYTVTGAGSDIWGTSDNLRYDYTTLTGNGQIIAEVASQQESSSYAKAGVMIRNGSSIASNAAEISMLLEPDQKAEFQTRATTGASTNTKEMTNITFKWVKLVRNGSSFSGYVSSNGTSWTLVGTSTVSMGSTVTIGLAVTAHDPTKTSKATFSDVAIAS